MTVNVKYNLYTKCYCTHITSSFVIVLYGCCPYDRHTDPHTHYKHGQVAAAAVVVVVAAAVVLLVIVDEL